MHALVIIPAYKPDEKLLQLTEQLQDLFAPRMIIVDDGSGEAYLPIFRELRRRFGSQIDFLRHRVNKGKGAALKTAMRHARLTYPQCVGVVTADADLQHSPEDIYRTVLALQENPEALILGSRDFSHSHVPARSRWGNRITSLVFRLRTGVSCPDTQTGLRGLPMSLIADSLTLRGKRYEYEMNLLLMAALKNVPLVQVPIQTIYIDGNRSSHFNKLRDPILIYWNILRFRLP